MSTQKLELKDRVTHTETKETGKVIETDWAMVKIRWDNDKHPSGWFDRTNDTRLTKLD